MTNKTEVKTAPFVESGDKLAEEAFQDGRHFYLVYDIRTGQVTEETEVNVGETTYKPMVNDHAQNRQVLLPSQTEEYGTEEALAKEIEAFLNRWHEETDPLQRKIDVMYVFLTHVAFGKDCLGMLPQVPYRRRVGWFGAGKSRGTEVLGAICYRPYYIAGCGSDAALRRRFDLWRGTAIIDEADFSRSDLHATITKVLNIGFDAHLGFYDLQDTEDPSKSYSLYVYGPKVMATREEFTDLALESRCLTAQASDKTKPMPIALSDRFYQESLHLRNKLLLWRFRNYYRFKEQVRRLEDPNLETEIFGGLQISGRIKQVMAPLWLIADDALKARLREIAENLDKDIKARDETFQISLQVNEALRALLQLDKSEINTLGDLTSLVDGVGYKLANNQYIVIPLKDIARKTLDDSPDFEGTESKKIANAIRRIMLFTVKAGTGNRRMVYVPLTHLKDLYPSHTTLTRLVTLTRVQEESIKTEVK